MTTFSENSLFFAGSDEEDGSDTRPPQRLETTSTGETSSNTPQAISQAPNPLFFADSDEEDMEIHYDTRKPSSMLVTDEDMELDVDATVPDMVEIPRASSVSSMSSGPNSARDDSPPLSRPTFNEPPPKRRKLSPPLRPALDNAHDSFYLGYFLVDNAWSTVKGTGYVKAGDEIRIERDEPDRPPPPPKKTSKDKGSGGKKQLTIANMLKPAPAKPTKKKQDSVVRITNSKGFGMCIGAVRHADAKLVVEFGRLPQDVASWVSRLLDLGKHKATTHGMRCLIALRRYCGLPQLHHHRMPSEAYYRG